MPRGTGRQPASVRVRLPQPRRDHRDRPDAGHPLASRSSTPPGWSTPTDTTRRRTRSSPPRRSRRGAWRAADVAHEDDLLHYVRSLEHESSFRLTVWPYHAMLGGIGHALVSAVEEAVFFHEIARASRRPSRSRATTRSPSTIRRSAPRSPMDRPGESREVERGPARAPARLRRGRDRGAGEEPLRRLDDRRPARARAGGGRARLPARGLHVAGRRSRRRRLHGRGGRRLRPVRGGRAHVVRSTDPIESWPGFGA